MKGSKDIAGPEGDDPQREDTRWIQLVAGTDTGGVPVLEKLQVMALEGENRFELLRSPLFVRNLAAGDIFTCEENSPSSFRIIQRSGNLAVRVFRKGNIGEMELALTPEVEKLGGRLDLQSDRALVYSIHVNIGFAEIERLFDGAMARFPDSVWYYGNIYDPADGVTPLNWWHEFIGQI